MKKLFIVLMFVFLNYTLLVCANVKSSFEIAEFDINIGNDVVKFSYPVYLKDDSVYVSVRELCNRLKIPIHWNEAKREVDINIYDKKIQVSEKTEYNEEGVIPDPETAYLVGKTILEKYCGRTLEYETDTRIYSLDTRYLKEENAWQIIQVFRFKNESSGGGIGWADYVNIKLSKYTGEVL